MFAIYLAVPFVASVTVLTLVGSGVVLLVIAAAGLQRADYGAKR